MPEVDAEWAVMLDAVGVLNVSREYGLPHRWDTHHADVKTCVAHSTTHPTTATQTSSSMAWDTLL